MHFKNYMLSQMHALIKTVTCMFLNCELQIPAMVGGWALTGKEIQAKNYTCGSVTELKCPNMM